MNVSYRIRSLAITPALLQPFAGSLDKPGYYIDWGPIQISAGNLVMIGIGLLLFVLALVIPFPKGRKRS